MLSLPPLIPRVIPSLLLLDDVLVKTHKFSKPRYVGDPVNTINLFNKFEVDEIVLLDIGCSRAGSKPNFELIEELASECWVPLSYGGGIRSVSDAQRILNSGVEKIILNGLLYSDPEEVRRCADAFGSSSVVACLDVKKGLMGGYQLMSQAGRKKVGFSIQKAVEHATSLCVGEILINDMERDGTGRGYDLTLVSDVASRVSLPVVALGGAGSLSDFQVAIEKGASAVSAGTFFVFQRGLSSGVLVSYPSRKELEDLFYGA